MYSNKSELRDNTTDVVDFFIDKRTFNFQGIEFQIYPDTKNPNTPDYAIKRNDTNQPKRISGLFQEGSRLKGDTRKGQERRYFQLEITPDKKQINLIGFRYAIELIGINAPVEQNNLFTGHLGGLESITKGIRDYSEIGIYIIGATGTDNQLNITSEPI
jgi:hypothetical protein